MNPERQMDPPLVCFNKLQTSLINSFVDIFVENKWTTNYFDFCSIPRGKRIENAPKNPYTTPAHFIFFVFF